MKRVVAFVHADRAQRVVQALERAELFHLSMSRVHAIVQPDTPIVRAQLASEGWPEVRLEAYRADQRVDSVVALIRERTQTGELPTGAVFVHPVELGSALHQSRS